MNSLTTHYRRSQLIALPVQQITVVWTGSLLLQGLKVYYLMERKHANNAMMMKES